MMLSNYRPRAIGLCLPVLPPPRWPRLWQLATLFGVIVLVMLIAVPIASAWQPRLVANLDCNGRVTFTVTADIQNSTRDNTNVAVMDTSGGAQPISTGVFNAANNWSFSGSYTIPMTVTSDTLTPQAGVWSNGTEASNGPSVTVTRPSSCPAITTALSSSTTAAGGAVYDSATLSGATADAGGTVTYTLYAESSCTTLSTTPALNETVNVDNGSIPHSSAVTFANAGTYYWQAVYSGDNSNGAATSPCTSEPLSVTAPPQPSPQPTTAPAAAPPTATPATATPAPATPAPATPAPATPAPTAPPASPGSPGVTTTTPPVPSVSQKPPAGSTQTPPASGTQTPPAPGTQKAPAGGSDYQTGRTAAPFTPPIVTTTHPPTGRPKLVSHVPPTTAG